jgi:hypothetical protein
MMLLEGLESDTSECGLARVVFISLQKISEGRSTVVKVCAAYELKLNW